ncbi:bifunctional 2',3'-cyclic-nucleotide 2'-phosphodiesterase/3'-nucleotidase [Marinomonas sp. M1K-6]|uniref:Bifunctional 2',3'-cyclic-nucleotide 2'-phosphodiesterase/3'-nucleotidase n=1 Tax=Marinomonas profundi TaxID=2726122 RepID=A0A847RC36_9GAMM|nr:bifunctional 2',3'-cyclic-nucleotide 2'-phosphodiesterase/3'-nucleotidase [Marinomonas profundi]NLQ18847.1 bifunctional 2',3'-cyclic-nucleotide 2'-phosphodiesterase/3'-nucleotidase [Marinomonas profundi]UDV01775.1 bifunctional 2',3'-cyclic-nucleotide 2'-phosphodiesterase/3'-nucleotidase [Marinomonas profundi]
MTFFVHKGATLFASSLLLATMAQASTIDLRVMETTDIHMNLVDYDYYGDKQSDAVGLSRVATLIKAARAEVTNSVLVDNGDLLQGTPLGDYVAKGRVLRFGETHPAYKAMNLLDYDVGNVGNHEFNYGLDFLMKSLSGANFPYVNSNVYVDDGDNDASNDQPYFQPYLIKDKTFVDSDGNKQTVKIGYIGFVPPQIMTWDKDNLTHKVIAKDIIETANKYVPEMKAKGADVVIAIPHSGMMNSPYLKGEENASYHLAKVDGIDAILFGHSHRIFPGDKAFDAFDGVDSEKGTVFGKPATMPGFWGSHLGVIDLKLEPAGNGWKVADGKAEVRAIARREGRNTVALVEADASINEAVETEHEGTLAYMRRKVGESTADINSFFALVQDDPSIQIVNNAQIWYVENIVRGTSYEGLPILSAAAPFKAGGRGGPEYYTDVPKGDIALKNVSDLYIYPNDLKVVKLTGAQVVAWLEVAAGQFNQIDATSAQPQELVNQSFPTYNFDVIDGISYRIDVTQPARYNGDGEVVNNDAHRITQVMFNGEPLNMGGEFLVATNNYRAGGGGHFPNLNGETIVIDAPDKNRDVVANYLLSQKTINPAADGNWSFTGFGKANVLFTTTPKAKEAASKNMTYQSLDENGFAIFRLK